MCNLTVKNRGMPASQGDVKLYALVYVKFMTRGRTL